MTGFNPVSAPTMVSLMSCRPSRDSSERLSASAASRRVLSSRKRRSFSSHTVNGSSSRSSICTCDWLKRCGGRATRITRPIGPAARFKGPIRASPESPLGTRPLRNSSSFSLATSCTSRRRHHCDKRSKPPESRSLRLLTGAVPGRHRPTATVSMAVRRLQTPHDDQIDRQTPKQGWRALGHSVANFDVPAGLSPNIEQQLAELFH